MKYLAAVVLVAVAVGTVAAAKEAGVGPFNSGLSISLSPPKGLSQKGLSGWHMRAGAWSHNSGVQLSAWPLRKTPHARLQIQLTGSGAGPSGKPTPAHRVSPHSVVVRALGDGTYRWWARYYNGQAVSPWVSFSSAVAFGIDTQAPQTPSISSPTNPSHTKVYRSGTLTFNFSAKDSGSGVTGFWYALDRAASASGQARPRMLTTRPTTTFRGVATGAYSFAVRARDRAGNWSPPATYSVKIDSTPPTVVRYGFSAFNFNPKYTSMTLNYRVDSPAKIRIGIYRQSDTHLVRLVTARSTRKNQLLHYTWHGRNNRGQIVAPGAYTFYIRTTDQYGNTALKELSGLEVLNQRIVVSLSRQRLWAYNGHHLFLTSLVTTGNKALPTPTGTFTILGKYNPFTFRSSEPQGSLYWYPPSKVEYAMLFQSGGYYIHDAPWRSFFGPGSNSQLGKPGENYTGTHGCVNVPADTAARLYNWAPDGTPVIVVK